MNNKAMVLSMALAGLAVWLVLTSIQSIERQTVDRYGKEITVIVAKEDIREMATIEESVIDLKVIPVNFVEPESIRYSEKIDATSEIFKKDMKLLAGSIALVPIKKGEQIAFNKIREPGLRTGLAPQITPGRRAFTINVSEQSSVGKLVKPGDRVDLIAVMELGNGGSSRENRMARTLLQDVVVLAVGRHVTNNVPRKLENSGISGKPNVRSLAEFDGFSSVTLEVEPSQAQMLALFTQGSSGLMMSLRNSDDTDRANLTAVTTGDVVGMGRMPAANQGGVKP